MKNIFIKIVAVALAIVLLLTAFTFLRQNELSEIITQEKDQPLSVAILYDISSGTSPLTVNFKPLLLNSKNNGEFLWEFGDGNTSNEKQPTYIYRTSGIFKCNLTIKEETLTASDNLNITVFPNNPPKIKILCKTTAFRPERVYFNAEVFDPEGEELTYQWILKHPLILGGYEPQDTFNTKNFSKLFIRDGRYVAELTVTDTSGNKVTDYEIISVQKSQIEGIVNSLIRMYTITLPGQLDLIWNLLNIIKLEKIIDNNWLNMPSFLQKIIKLIIILSAGRIIYEPPIPKADLVFSEIQDINLSTFVNDTTGEIAPGAVASSSFTIENNDSLNTAKSTYITLQKPFSGEKGISEEIEVKDLTVGLDVGVMSNKMFYNGEYTSWENCYNIEKLAPGDLINLGLTITIREGAIFNKGTYPCKLYIYQEKYLDKAEYVDEIPFTIVL